MKLKIYVLTDNVASNTCKAEHGLSYLVVFDEKVLFDTGQTNLFLENAQILDSPIHETKYLVLSHGHYDHGNGLKFIDTMKLICHPDVFVKRYSGKDLKYVGLDVDEAELTKLFTIQKSKEPVWISDKMVYLGEIPRKMNFEKNTSTFYLEGKIPDPIHDDTGMVVVMNQGLFVISGCAHSGI
ncbi:MAG: MBL fold metallo-hydrolase [Salinivirgaceae bacterium]